MQCHCSISVMRQLRRDTGHVPAGLEYTRGGPLEIDQDPDHRASQECCQLTDLDLRSHPRSLICAFVVCKQQSQDFLHRGLEC